MAVNLDAARAARREAQGVGPTIIWGGKEYQLPVELPYELLEAMRGLSGDEAPAAIVDVAKALLGEHYQAFLDGKPSLDDVNELIGGVMQEYNVGNPSASST